MCVGHGAQLSASDSWVGGVWTQEGERILVERAKRHTTAEVHQALFSDAAPGAKPVKTLAELNQGVRQRMQRRHAGR